MAQSSNSDGNFRLVFPERNTAFTGERMTLGLEGPIEFEHIHRYCLARDLCCGLDVVDLACGEGYGSAILADTARSVIGVDIDSNAINYASIQYNAANLRFLRGDAVKLPLDDSSVDVVVSFETLEHVREHAQFIIEVKRVLRPDGHLIISTPDRATYSARGEPVNEFHLLELTQGEFQALLSAHFAHVSVLRQRAILGSIIASSAFSAPFRTYERRSKEYLEASSGLARSPYLIAIASDTELRALPSSVYLDRRDIAEVVTSHTHLPGLVSQAAELGEAISRLNRALSERETEVGRLSGALSEREAEAARLNDALCESDAEVARLNDKLSASDKEADHLRTAASALRAEADRLDKALSWAQAHHAGRLEQVNGERAQMEEQLSSRVAELAQLRQQYDKLQRSSTRRIVAGVIHGPRTIGRTLRWPFVRLAFHKNGRPRGWLRPLIAYFRRAPQTAMIQDAIPVSGRVPTTEPEKQSTADVDPQKKTILVVSHEATRSGAPVLALNLIQRFSERYNVVCLLLGGGELTEEFRRASVSVYIADGIRMSDPQLDDVIGQIVARYPLMFAIANTVASRRTLAALKKQGVPTVSLVHEFASYMRPRSTFRDVIDLSTETVFSTSLTLKSAIADIWLYPGASIHIEHQGKCKIPPGLQRNEQTALRNLWSARNALPREKRKFLVIGVGAVELRKGVDLFASCAAVIKNQAGGDRFQFLWIGGGFDPESELNYSVFVADQIKRAGIEPHIEIMPPTSQIELAYQTADLMLLPSRLDPLPNVAIDALTTGLPVLCFEKTTGIADFLIDIGLKDHCVAKYLDTHDLARKLRAFADSEELRARVSECCRAAAQEQFDMDAYVSKIEGIAMKAVSNESRIRDEVQTILGSGRFRSDFFALTVVGQKPEKIVEAYVRRMASGLAVRKPMPGFHPTVYASLQKTAGKAQGDPFADFLREGLPEGPWLQKVIQPGGGRRARADAKLRAALHLHAYYPDQLPGIIERLNLNTSFPDLFISVVSPEAAAAARETLSLYQGRLVDLQVTPNLGRDAGPLLTQFGRTLCSSYDIIGHLHTKQSVHVTDRSVIDGWNTFLLENLVGGERGGAMLDGILSEMELNPAIGIVFPDDPNVMSWTDNRGYAEEIAGRLGWKELPEQFNFPIGAMFWMRSSILSKFVDLEFDWSDYPSEPLRNDGTTLHALERLYGVAPEKLGMTCAVTNIKGLTR